MGCLSERYKKELKESFPEVDNLFGVKELPKIVESANGKYYDSAYYRPITSTPPHYAYVKISEGCNRHCSFCAIPLIRGKHISNSIEDVYKQIEYLANNGKKEIMLISQDTSYYGKDLYKDFKLKDLLYKLVEIEKLRWLRLHYLYPSEILEPVIDIIASNPQICKYIDIPFQHISDNILQAMKREHNKKSTYDLIELFRKKLPEAAIRTTMIVGFPNETDKDFDELLNFVREVKFDRLGAFTYSEEEDTAAAKLKDNVPKKVKKQRLEALMQLQSEISYEKNQEKIGKTYKVIIDSEQDDFYIGRTEFDSPEVDNEVLITKNQKLQIGDFYNVKINSAEEFDIYGEVVK